jgi:hypothetical protein
MHGTMNIRNLLWMSVWQKLCSTVIWKDACIFRSNYKTAEIISDSTVQVIIRQSAERILSGRHSTSRIPYFGLQLLRWYKLLCTLKMETPGTSEKFLNFSRLHGVTFQGAVFFFSSQWLNTTLTRSAQIPGTRSPGPLNLRRRRLIFVELASCHHSGA